MIVLSRPALAALKPVLGLISSSRWNLGELQLLEAVPEVLPRSQRVFHVV